jgi:hypothetical protein
MEGGHMLVPSIGQVIPPSEIIDASAANDRAGNVHITPTTWQTANTAATASHFTLWVETIWILPFIAFVSDRPRKSGLFRHPCQRSVVYSISAAGQNATAI